jgi:hypothetical protein
MQGNQLGLSSGDELSQRIKYLKDKRKSDLVNLVLNAAGKGDLAGLKQALRVSNIISNIHRNRLMICSDV